MRNRNRWSAPLAGLMWVWCVLGCVLARAGEESADGSLLKRDLLWGANWLLPEVTGFENLSVEQCVRLALVQNQDLQALRQQLLSSHQDLRLSENFFALKGNVFLQHDQDVYTPEVELGGSSVAFDPIRNEWVNITNRTAVIDDDLTTLGVEATKRLQTGGTLSLRPQLRESDYQDNQWSTEISMSYTQPLLDGFGREVATADLEISRLSLRLSENSLDGEVRSLIVRVIAQYYDLMKTYMILQERRQALERSREQLRAVKIRRQEGEVTQLDVLQAELQVSGNENSLLVTMNNLAGSLMDFKIVLGLAPEEAFGLRTEEVGFATAELDYRQLADYALEHRLDYENRALALEQSRLSLRKAKNSRLPDLNLYANYRFYDADDDTERVWDIDQGSISVGAILQFPLGDVSERVAWEKARLNLEQAEIRRDQTRRQILGEVDKVKRQIDTLRSQITVLRKNVEAAEESFRLATLSYEVGGLISSFDLAQSQDKLTSARTDYVSALIDHRIALVQLDRALGLDVVALVQKHLGWGR